MPDTLATEDRLRAEIHRTGYYPDLVLDSLRTALGGEAIRSFLVHHEATFDRDELRRHITVLALTHSRLIVAHVDEHPPRHDPPSGHRRHDCHPERDEHPTQRTRPPRPRRFGLTRSARLW